MYNKKMNDYYKQNTTSFRVVLNKQTDKDIIEFLNTHKINKNRLVKDFLRNVMKLYEEEEK